MRVVIAFTTGGRLDLGEVAEYPHDLAANIGRWCHYEVTDHTGEPYDINPADIDHLETF